MYVWNMLFTLQTILSSYSEVCNIYILYYTCTDDNSDIYTTIITLCTLCVCYYVRLVTWWPPRPFSTLFPCTYATPVSGPHSLPPPPSLLLHHPYPGCLLIKTSPHWSLLYYSHHYTQPTLRTLHTPLARAQ